MASEPTDEQPTDGVYDLSLRLLEAHQLTDRQWTAWYARWYMGQDGRAAAQWIWDNYSYEISHTTVIADARYAHEIIVTAYQEEEEGRVRLGVTVAAGSETWFAIDQTMAGAARRMRVIPRIMFGNR